MSLYTVSPIALAAVPDVHNGTGSHSSTNWIVVPGSVPPPGNLQFTGDDQAVTTMLFELSDNVVPNWFGVAIPNGIQDFTRAHIFFHPLPAQAGYRDSDYPSKSGKWPELFYYMERLGYQLDGAHRNQVIIMPFLTEAAQDTGIFAANWSDIVTDILTAVRLAMGMDDGSAFQISQVVVSSFSVGIVYSNAFRQKAAGLAGLMAEIWDFDGNFSTAGALSRALHSTADYQVIKYDQIFSSDHVSYHVPLPRWTNFVSPPQSSSEVHAYIRDFMFLHAASASSVGALMPAPATTGATPVAPWAGAGTTSAPALPGSGATTGTPGPVAESTPVAPTVVPFNTSSIATGATAITSSVSDGGAAQRAGFGQPGETVDPSGLPGVVFTGSVGISAELGHGLPFPIGSSGEIGNVGGQQQTAIGADPMTQTTAPLGSDCDCSAAITAMVATVAANANVAITSISAIAAASRSW